MPQNPRCTLPVSRPRLCLPLSARGQSSRAATPFRRYWRLLLRGGLPAQQFPTELSLQHTRWLLHCQLGRRGRHRLRLGLAIGRLAKTRPLRRRFCAEWMLGARAMARRRMRNHRCPDPACCRGPLARRFFAHLPGMFARRLCLEMPVVARGVFLLLTPNCVLARLLCPCITSLPSRMKTIKPSRS